MQSIYLSIYLSEEENPKNKNRQAKKKEKKKEKSLYAVWSLFIDNYIKECRCNLLSNSVIDKLSFGIYRDIKHIFLFPFFLTPMIYLCILLNMKTFLLKKTEKEICYNGFY